MNKQDKYKSLKKFLAVITGLLVLYVSWILSAQGFALSKEAIWIGYVIALAVTSAELIFNTRVRELNWTIVVVGVLAYTYSIYTNIAGFFSNSYIQFGMNVPTLIACLAGAFIDVYPEMALAWAFDASLDGDFVGNLAKVVGDGKLVNPEQSNISPEIHSKLPKRREASAYPIGTTHTLTGKYPFIPAERPAPKPTQSMFSFMEEDEE
jgi:hypothetical protein